MMAGVKYVSLHEVGGYGEAARRYMLALARAGVPLTWTPLIGGAPGKLYYRPTGARGVGDTELDPICNRPLDYDTVVVHTVPEYFPQWRDREAGKRLVGYTVWETDRLPAHWPPLLQQLDHLLVPTQWNRDVFARSGVRVPISVVPHLPPVARRGAPPAVDRSDGDFVFRTCGDWTRRKAVDRTIEAYLLAFTADDPVRLVVKTSARDRSTVHGRFSLSRTTASLVAAQRRRHRHRRPARVEVIAGHIPDWGMEALAERADCYVSLFRGEAWGLDVFDAAIAGKPVVVTGFGGPREYLPPDLALFVDHRLVPVDDPAGRPSYTPDQHWAEPDVEHGARLMREVFEGRTTARDRATRLAELLRRRYDPDSINAGLRRAIAGG
jgi:glycosyltransferase involved in cell wall biosynthesis